MASPETIVIEVRAQFEGLLAEMVGGAAQGRTADGMERHVFRRVLALGRGLLRVFVAQQAPATRPPVVVTPGAVRLA